MVAANIRAQGTTGPEPSHEGRRPLDEVRQLNDEYDAFWENVWTLLAQSAREGNVNSTTRKGKGKRQDTKGQRETAERTMRGTAQTRDPAGTNDAAAGNAIAEARGAVDALFGSSARSNKRKDFGQKGLLRAIEIV